MSFVRTLFLLLALMAGGVASAEPVDINRADAATLAAAMNGIGLKRAEAIVAYRDQHGPFTSVDELINVKGVGLKTLERNREALTVATPAK